MTRLDGAGQLEAAGEGTLGEAKAVGERVAKQLLEDGARPWVEAS